MFDITAVVLTYNEELHIERCVKNLLRIASKVYVIDGFSSDSTVCLAHKAGAYVIQHRYYNQAQQFQWALDNCKIDTEWVLRLDADEYLTEELIAEISEKLSSLPAQTTGIYLKRNVIFMNHIIRFGSLRPVRILRMWRNGKAFMEQRWMDEHIVLTEGDAVTFNHRFIDDNLNGLSAWIQKHNDYSNREILVELDKKYNLFDKGESATLGRRNHRKSAYYKMPKFFRAFVYFFVRYFCLLGFLDGIPGLVWHTLQAYWYRFLVDAKMLEMNKRLGKNPSRDVIVSYAERYYGIIVEDKD